MKMRTGTIIALCFVLFASGCASTALLPVTDPGFAAFESDETALWKRCAEDEKRINESGFVYSDKDLEEYVNAVARKLQPAGVYDRIPFRIKVLKDPYINAFALANGAVYLHTGLIASMENEAQLATLLGHEMTHAVNRHEARKLKSAKNATAFMSTLFLMTGGLGAVFGPVAAGSVAGYSRELEAEADQAGFALTEAAGYDLNESTALFGQMKRELEDEKVKEPYFFGSHPRLVERIASYEQLLALRTDRKPGVKNTEAFQARVRKMLLDNAQLDLQFGRYLRAAGALERYAERYPGEAEAYFLLGEANRQQGGAERDKKADEYYRKVISLDSGHFRAHKMLGMMLYKAGEKTGAKEHLKKYLVLNANAPDRSYIEGYLRACDQQAAGK